MQVQLANRLLTIVELGHNRPMPNSFTAGHSCMRVYLWAVFTLISVCNAQRADDPNSAAKINDQLRRETLPTVEKRAAAGDADAQLELALGYSVGGYLPKNDKLAAEWCSRAARQGSVAAETTMGYL